MHTLGKQLNFTVSVPLSPSLPYLSPSPFFYLPPPPPLLYSSSYPPTLPRIRGLVWAQLPHCLTVVQTTQTVQWAMTHFSSKYHCVAEYALVSNPTVCMIDVLKCMGWWAKLTFLTLPLSSSLPFPQLVTLSVVPTINSATLMETPIGATVPQTTGSA